MTTARQFQMVMRDMLFITWAIDPEVVRRIVDPRLELDTIADSSGQPSAFVSAVCFNVADVRSAVVPLPRLSFNQVNYRAYVRSDGIPAVCFLDMKVNSRMVTALTGFLNVPIRYEDIDIKTASNEKAGLHYSIKSDGLRASAVMGEEAGDQLARDGVTADFITDRLLGYVGSGESMYRIDVDQPGLGATPARVESVKASRLEQLGVLTRPESMPHSALYVREARFGADTPVRVS